MKTITLTALREQIERKKAAIGWVDDEASIAKLRNTGMARTPTKRELLARIEARAKAGGRKTLNSNYQGLWDSTGFPQRWIDDL